MKNTLCAENGTSECSIIDARQNRHFRMRRYRRKKKSSLLCFIPKKCKSKKFLETPKEAVFKISSHSDDGGSRRH